MPNTQITKAKLNVHFQYSKKIYIFGIIFAILASSLLFTVTRHVPKDEEQVSIALVDSYCDVAKLDSTLPALISMGYEKDKKLEDVTFLSIAYSGDATGDYYGAQLYTVQLYAGGNDIFVQNRELTDDMVASGVTVALDTLDAFDEFVARFPGVELIWYENPELAALADPEAEEAPEIEKHVYALDFSSLLEFNTLGAYDARGKYACVMLTSANIETSFATLMDIYGMFTPSEAAE